MDKNITEMSFDEIFPETSYPKTKSLTENDSIEDYDRDDYSYDDYGTDISDLAADMNATPSPQSFEARPSQPDIHNSFNSANSYSPVNPANYTPDNPAPPQFSQASPPPPYEMPKQFNQFFDPASANNPSGQKVAPPFILAIISLFLTAFFPVGLILSIIAFVMNKKNVKGANTIKSEEKMCKVALGINIFFTIIRLLSLISPFFNDLIK